MIALLRNVLVLSPLALRNVAVDATAAITRPSSLSVALLSPAPSPPVRRHLSAFALQQQGPVLPLRTPDWRRRRRTVSTISATATIQPFPVQSSSVFLTRIHHGGGILRVWSNFTLTSAFHEFGRNGKPFALSQGLKPQWAQYGARAELEPTVVSRIPSKNLGWRKRITPVFEISAVPRWHESSSRWQSPSSQQLRSNQLRTEGTNASFIHGGDEGGRPARGGGEGGGGRGGGGARGIVFSRYSSTSTSRAVNADPPPSLLPRAGNESSSSHHRGQMAFKEEKEKEEAAEGRGKVPASSSFDNRTRGLLLSGQQELSPPRSPSHSMQPMSDYYDGRRVGNITSSRSLSPVWTRANYHDKVSHQSRLYMAGGRSQEAAVYRKSRDGRSSSSPLDRVGVSDNGDRTRRVGLQRSAAADSRKPKAFRFKEDDSSSRRTGNVGSEDIRPKKWADEEEAKEEVRRHTPRRLEGEQRWQYAVRKKQLGLAGHSRGSTSRKPKQQFEDEEGLGSEPKGDDWRRKKTAWLCKQIPTLRPRPIVTILNEQRKWIKAPDTKYIIEHLLLINQTLRAHRVFKWEMQQPWHVFDFDLSTKVAVQLGRDNKLSRTRDMYNEIIRNGRVPDRPTYTALINCYITDGESPALAQACSLYNQMSQLGGHDPPPTLSYDLFQGLVQKGQTHLDLADQVFRRIKTSGLVCSLEMYSLLIHAHGTKGNQERVDILIEEMQESGLPIGEDVYAAILKACAKDGNVEKGERAFADLKVAAGGHKPSAAIYSSVIKMYGKAGRADEAFQAFEEMRAAGTCPNLIVYEPMIEVAAWAGRREEAEALLKEARERGIPSLQASYNAVMELYSKSGLMDELESTFHAMRKMVIGEKEEEEKEEGHPTPNIASFNTVLEAYVRNGLMEKAEGLYKDLREKRTTKFGPNRKSYELMIRLYGEEGSEASGEKLKEVFNELKERKLPISEAASGYLQAVQAVSPKQLEAHRLSKLKLDRDQRQILAGVLLAGAAVDSHDHDRTYQFHFSLDSDSEIRAPLLHHLFQIFSDWATDPAPKLLSSSPPKEGPSNLTKPNTQLAFQTVSHGSFRFFAHQYRPDHKAVIPRLVHRWLTPRALAYWYMYGGRRCPHTGDILFNASLYSDQEIMMVVNALKSRKIDGDKRRTQEDGLVISFSGRSSVWLWGLMEPFILPEVKALLKPDDAAAAGIGEYLNEEE